MPIGPLCPVCGVVQPPADIDDFARLQLSSAVRVDAEALRDRRLALLAQVHPDRFAGHRAEARAHALAQAVAINDAARTLADPRRRAAMLMQTRGWSIDTLRLNRADQLRVAEYRNAVAELAGTDAHTERQALERLMVGEMEDLQDTLYTAVEHDEAPDQARAALACFEGLWHVMQALRALDTTPDRNGKVRR